MHTKRISIGYGKDKKWVTTPRPGAHKRSESLPLLLIVRDYIGYADTGDEAKKIIQEGNILVDKKVRKDHKFAVGLMDVIDVPKIKKHYRVLPSDKGLVLKEIDESESKIKLAKITGKNRIRGGKLQLAMHDGGVMLVDKTEYAPKDTLVLELPTRKLAGGIKFEKGNIALVVSGRHSGQAGKIKDILEGTTTRKSNTTLENLQTLTEYAFIVGTDKPQIKI
jgi:small subunit ribosomal protein S4e